MNETPIVSGSREEKWFQQMLALHGAPAYVRRAQNVEAAWQQIVERCRRQRHEWLGLARTRLGFLRALAGEWTALEVILAGPDDVAALVQLERDLEPNLKAPPEPTRSRRRLRHALHQRLPTPPSCLSLPGAVAMFDLLTGRRSTDCRGVSRREFLRVGALSALGLTLPAFLRLKQQAAADGPTGNARRDVSCILLWMQGGPSHIDTFDPKPNAPVEIRGEFGTIPTRQTGVRIVEHFPLLAQQFDKLSLIRGHDPKNGSHGVADHLMMSGRPFNPTMAFPCYGSVVARERGYRNGMFPFVQLGRNIDRRFNGGVAGFLGDQYNPFEVLDDPAAAVFRVRDLSPPAGSDPARMERRHAMLAEVDQAHASLSAANSTAVQARDSFYERAHALVTSPQAQR